jgi:hypothetical protein
MPPAAVQTISVSTSFPLCRFLVIIECRNGFEIFGFEDLIAIQAPEIIDAVPSCDELCMGVRTNGIHN